MSEIIKRAKNLLTDCRISAVEEWTLAAELEEKGESADECNALAEHYKDTAEVLESLLAEPRARVVVVPERKSGQSTIPGLHRNRGWNACLDELARLNGKTVSEGLLQRLVDFAAAHPSGKGLAAEVGALLSEQEGGKQ
ncbi:TPA: hypothetical protein L3878_001194 [Pseudomonas aeruginosa]|nr:hypothetical protein [Pseudomonas aeruginosa]